MNSINASARTIQRPKAHVPCLKLDHPTPVSCDRGERGPDAFAASCILLPQAPLLCRQSTIAAKIQKVCPPAYGTTTTPKLPACPTILLAIPSRLKPLNRVSLCLIFAISYTCLRLTVPTVPLTAFPAVGLLVDVLPFCPSWLFIGPGTFPAPRILFLVGRTPAALRSSVAVGGVRI